MTSYTYIWKGETAVAFLGVGNVEPGATFTSPFPVNHVHAELQEKPDEPELTQENSQVKKSFKK